MAELTANGRPIRVLLVAPVHMIGGQAQAARDIMRGFTKDAEIEVLVQAIDPRWKGPLGWLTNAKFLRTLIRPMLFTRQLFRSARNADVLQVLGAAHTAFLFGAMPAIVVGRLLRRHIILNYHDGRAKQHFKYWGPFLRWALRRVDCLVVPSRYLEKEFRAHGFTVKVVPNGIDTEAFAFRPTPRVPHRLVSTRLLERLYAVEVTLLAFRRLKLDYPDLVLDVYGDGAAGAWLRELTQRLELKGVTFHGEIAHERMPEVLEHGGVMVNSSRVDNMPHFVLEAYSAGVPIVSTAAGGIPYMIDPDRTGLLVPPDDPDQLAAAVRRLFDDPELAARLEAAGYEETARYAWPNVRESWRRVYRSVVSPASQPEAA